MTDSQPPITVYGHFSSLPTGKVVLALNMTGIAFTFREIDVFGGAQFEPEFRALNPACQVPVLIDGDTALTQSAVILLHLAENCGLYGGNTASERRRVLEWLFFEADTFASLRIPRTLRHVFGDDAPEIYNFHKARGEKTLEKLDAWFADHDFLIGSLPTVADIAMFPILDNCREGGFDTARHPAIGQWRQRMLQLAGCRNHYDLMRACTTVSLDKLPSHKKD